MICGWLLLVLGSEALGRGYAVNCGFSLLVLGLVAFDGHHNVS